MTISDLHTVKEDFDEQDDDMNPAAFVHNQKEYADHIFQAVEYDSVLKEVKQHCAKIQKVKDFLLMCALRKRHRAKRQAQKLIRRYLKGFVIRKEVKEQLIEERENARVVQLQTMIHRASKTDLERMHQAAQKIQRSIYNRIKQRREGRELRAELAKLPRVVWNGYLKMKDLKANTNSLKMDMRFKFGR